MKVVLLGDGGVGKTAIAIQFCSNQFLESYDPTIEDSYRKQIYVKDQSVMLDILDTAGQEAFLALRDQWMREGDGFLMIYSILSHSSFLHIQKMHEQVMMIKEKRVNMILVANKSDDAEHHQVTREQGQQLAKEWKCKYIETSAKTGMNVDLVFYELVKEMMKEGKKEKKKCILV